MSDTLLPNGRCGPIQETFALALWGFPSATVILHGAPDDHGGLVEWIEVSGPGLNGPEWKNFTPDMSHDTIARFFPVLEKRGLEKAFEEALACQMEGVIGVLAQTTCRSMCDSILSPIACLGMGARASTGQKFAALVVVMNQHPFPEVQP